MDTRPCAGCGKPANQMPGHYRRVHASGLAICKKDIERLSHEHVQMRELLERISGANPGKEPDANIVAMMLDIFQHQARALLASIGKESSAPSDAPPRDGIPSPSASQSRERQELNSTAPGKCE